MTWRAPYFDLRTGPFVPQLVDRGLICAACRQLEGLGERGGH
jgi:hypothetical protein